MTFPANGPTEIDFIYDLNDRFSSAVAAGEKSERDKVLVQAAGFLHLLSRGGLAKTGEDADGKAIFEASDEIKSLLAERGIKNKVGAWNHCAQLVLGYTIETITDKLAKKKARNFVDRCARLFEALDYFSHVDRATFPSQEDKLAKWIDVNGGLDGVFAKHREALGGDEEAEKAELPDLGQFNEAIDANGITATPSAAIAPDLNLCLTRMNESGDLKIVPLTSVPASVLAGLSPYLPAMDASLPDEVCYWAQVTTLCMMFDRQDGDEVARPNEEQHAGSKKLPSLPIVMLTNRSSLTVAPSRVAAGIIARVTAKVDTVLPAGEMTWPYHLNGVATNRLKASLAGGISRASFNGVRYSKDTHLLTFESRNERIKPFSVRTLPLAAFGGSKHSKQWTIDVRAFAATAVVVVTQTSA